MRCARDETVSFQILVNEYRLIKEEAKQKEPEATAVIEELITAVKSRKTVSWGDLSAFEVALLAFSDRERLLCKFSVVADKYREIAGEKNFASRHRGSPDNCTNATDEALRAQLSELLIDIHEHLELYAACRQSRNAVLGRIVIPMSVLFLGFIAWLGLAEGEIPPIIYVIVAGSIGAMVSMIRRIQNSTGTDTNVLACIDLKHDRLNIYLAPAYGSVFSVVLLLFFSSQLLTGNIFPNIVTMDKEMADNTETVAEVMLSFVVNTYPETGVDCAKMIIWSFIAGFAEKFVPDTLDRLVSRGEKLPAQGAKKLATVNGKAA